VIRGDQTDPRELGGIEGGDEKRPGCGEPSVELQGVSAVDGATECSE
jgi:hypothetical protein